MSELDNPLLRKSKRFGYYTAMDEFNEAPEQEADPREGSGRYKEVVVRDLYGAGSMVGRRDYVVGEDGNYYNEDGERVYYWVRPRETDSTMTDYRSEELGIGQDMGGYYTEAEIRSAWDAKEGMGYFKERSSWDNYWGFISERQGLIQTGELPDPTSPEYMDGFPSDSVDTSPSNTGRDEEIFQARSDASDADASERAMAAFVEANAELMAKYGIESSFTNSDGDVFTFNGSTYTRTSKVDDHDYTKAAVGIMIGLAAGAIAGPLVTSALQGAGMSGAAASATSKAIINAATQLANTGEVSWEQALLTAAGAYGADVLGSMEGAVGGIVGKITDATDKFQELISTGNSIADAAIQAGGMDMLMQFVTTGEVNPAQAATAALLAGGSEALNEWKAAMDATGADADEYMADLAEYEEFQQAAIDADLKDPFLNPNYETVGDGVIVNTTNGIVYGVESGEELGNMADLDSDGDGVLSGDDLSEVNVTATPVDESLPRDPDSYYDVDGDGQYTEGVDTDLTAPSNTTNPDAFTNEWADERYAGLSGDQIVDQMQRDGFTDEQINSYMEHWNATNDLSLQELNTTDYGAITVNMEDKYTIGQTDEGTYYIARVDDNGEVSFTAISEEQYDELYGQMYGSADTGAGAVTSGDYSGVEGYLAEEGIGSTGNEFTGVNPYTGEGVGEEGDGWITLEDGDDTSSAVPVDFTDDTTDTTNDADATGDNNDSTAAGRGTGGGESPSTGGSADSGAIGGSGTQGGGAPSGGGYEFPDSIAGLFGNLGGFTPTGPAGGSDATGDTSGNTGGSGDALGGTSGNTGGAETGEGTGGIGGGDNTGAGDGTGAGVGEGTGTGESGSGEGTSGSGEGTGDGTGEGQGQGEGSGTDGGQGGGQGGNTGGGSGVAPGVGTGTAPGSGGGAGGGGLGDGGLMSGGGASYTPSWGQLFSYTTLTDYQKKQLEPQRDFIAEARRMMDSIEKLGK